jgi:hypothetical protein
LSDPPETAAVVVRDVFAELWPGRFDESQLGEDMSLGEGGLGLDSIDIVELVLECEERMGHRDNRAGDLLDATPVSIGRLIDHLAPA